jgi:YD repeat-containing protein
VVTTYTYDAAGRLGSLTSESGTTTRQYDAQGRITVETRANNPASAVAVNYLYDPAGEIAALGYPSGRRVYYARDAMGRITGVTTAQNAAAPVQTIVAGAGWNPYGPLAGMSFGNGIVASYTRDSLYRVTSPGFRLGLLRAICLDL